MVVLGILRHTDVIQLLNMWTPFCVPVKSMHEQIWWSYIQQSIFQFKWITEATGHVHTFACSQATKTDQTSLADSHFCCDVDLHTFGLHSLMERFPNCGKLLYWADMKYQMAGSIAPMVGKNSLYTLWAHKSIQEKTAVKHSTEAIKSLSWILSQAMSAANTF